ncbi:hypothetical protein F5I97DRAFT_1563674 [Phlebopus sp. FC_14]|nr:hypothetical protein F5I97DRAFT_1563674 [Phlebopus sp. FC_14]
MVPIGLSPASQTASSSSTLWATPSKEWVIPAKPKPGRKPKKEATTGPTPPKDEEDDESSGRRVQNRAAQRAFRERKQTQLAELQARLHSYEQGEIERNVALQNIAKKMKEENEELRRENQMLREKIEQLEKQSEETFDQEKKRVREDAPAKSSRFSPEHSIRKRPRMDDEQLENAHIVPFNSYPSSSSSSSEEAVSAGGFPSRMLDTPSQHAIFPAPDASITNILPYVSPTEPSITVDSRHPEDSYACVLCSPDAPCVCREIVMPQVATELAGSVAQATDDVDQQQIVTQLDQSTSLSGPSASMSILDNLPAYQAPVPIRRRTSGLGANPIFPLTPLPSSSPFLKCSGDPNNCMACADDNFGKAFCQAIGHSVNSSAPCVDCPRRTNQADEILVGGCCGDISKCGSCGIAPIISSTNRPRGPETIPTDDAWRQLKSHPNVAFADLTLLAEVVARRSKCTGSRVVISPAPGSVTPERLPESSHHNANTASMEQSVLLTDPHEQFHQKQREHGSPPRLVPQEVLIACGRRRMREVNADGVREALRLLDQKFAHAR